MKKLFVAIIALSLLSTGCKVFQKMKKKDEPATTQNTSEGKVFSVPATQSQVRENPTSDKMYEEPEKTEPAEKPVRTQSENFTFSAKADQDKNQKNSYFVIIGSFSSNENANRYKQELIPQGFSPIILHSETGYYRVCVNSFTDENEARQRIYQIRHNFPQYADTWLLIKK